MNRPRVHRHLLEKARTLTAALRRMPRGLIAACALPVVLLGWAVFNGSSNDDSTAGLSGEPTILAGAVSRPAEEPAALPAETSPGTPAEAQPPAATFSDGSFAYISIIIDDIGNNQKLGERAVTLPGAVTYAVLPHTPFAVSLATQAHALGKEVMLHAPMSNLARHPLGEGGLTPALTEQEFLQSLQRSLAAVPFVEGVNNHMGSELTSAKLQMQWLMRELKQRDLYFVDSLTTAESVAAKTAAEFDVPNLKRQVFLDNEETIENVDMEFRRLLAIAHSQGSAVGIGHPYEATIGYLEQVLPTLEAQGIRLLSITDMLRLHALSDSGTAE